MKEVEKLLDKALDLHNMYIGNEGNLEYSDKQYGYLCDEIEDVQVGYFKAPFDEVDSDYSERLREDGFELTKEEAIEMLTNRIEIIVDEIRENKKLKVGDVIYPEYGMTDTLSKPITIERVTSTQAISGNYKFKRDDKHHIKTVGDGGSFNRQHYYLETPELNERYHRQKCITYIKNYFNFDSLSTPSLNEIISILVKHK